MPWSKGKSPEKQDDCCPLSSTAGEDRFSAAPIAASATATSRQQQTLTFLQKVDLACAVRAAAPQHLTSSRYECPLFWSGERYSLSSPPTMTERRDRTGRAGRKRFSGYIGYPSIQAYSK